jgi:hypothetical protein
VTQGKRPGGLTALAVINFILGGMNLLGTFGLVAMLAMNLPVHDDESKRFVADLKAWPLAWLYIGLAGVIAVLLIVSGIGYLKQRRFLGRTLGNVYAVLGLLGAGMFLTAFPFRIQSVIEFVYPLLTLFLLNLTFKDDLVHGGERVVAPPAPTPSSHVALPSSAVHVDTLSGRASDRLLTGLRLEHVKMIALYWVRFSLRTGGGLVTLLLVLMVGLSVAGIFFTPVESILAKGPAAGFTEGQVAADLKRISEDPKFVDVVQMVTGTDEAETRYLLGENPALLSVIFLVLMWMFPFIACIGSFNQTAGDIGSRGLRYLLLRTERPNILAGRFVGTVGAAKAALALMVVIMLLYIGLKFRIYAPAALVMWGLQGFIAIVLLSVPYIAMCTWISCSMDSAFGALALCLVLTGGPMILIKILDATLTWDLEWLGRLIPWGWKYELLSGDVATRVTAYLVMLGFTALFLFLAFRTFHRRDL